MCFSKSREAEQSHSCENASNDKEGHGAGKVIVNIWTGAMKRQGFALEWRAFAFIFALPASDKVKLGARAVLNRRLETSRRCLFLGI